MTRQYSILSFIFFVMFVALFGPNIQSARGQCSLAASFSSPPAAICAGTSINFMNTTSGLNSSNSAVFSWQINGTIVSSTPNLAYIFNNPGNYWVALEVNNGNCTDDYWQYITVNSAPPAYFNYTLNNTMASFNAPFFPNAVYLWQFGDGTVQTTNTNNISHSYNAPDNYEACLTIQFPNGCSNTHCASLIVGANAACSLIAHFTPAQTGIICSGSQLSFTNDSNVPVGITTNFQWRINNILVSDNSLSYTATFNNPGNYVVTLTAISSLSCNSVYSYNVSVQEPFTPQIVSSPIAGTSYNFYVNPPPTQSNNTAFAYYWAFGDGTTLQSNSNLISHNYTGSGNFGVSVTMVSNGENSCNASVLGNESIVVEDNCTGENSCVLPGDINNDSEVNMDDLLSLGLIPFNNTGPQRPYILYNNALEYTPQTCQNWATSQNNGANYKHADGNGNGQIELIDKEAIVQNYNAELAPATTPTPSSKKLILTNALKIGDIDGQNDTLQFNLVVIDSLGNSFNLYGLRFEAQFLLQGSNININTLKANFDNSWLGQDIINLSKTNTSNTTITGGTTRYNQQNIFGTGGQIGTLQSIIDVDILGLSPVEGTVPAAGDVLLHIVLKKIKATTANGEQVYLGQKTFSYRLHTIPTFQVQAQAILEGAYNAQNGKMHPIATQLLPNMQPYNQAPWNYDGNEQLNPANIVNNNISDWVLVELRDSSGTNVLHQKAGLLLSNGQISDPTNPDNGLLSFYVQPLDTYYRIVVRHRNHLAVISNPVPLQNNMLFADFINNPNNNQTILLSDSNQYALIGGDFDANGLINYQDFNTWTIAAINSNPYNNSDCNLDGNTSPEDIDYTIQNIARMGHPFIRF